MNRQKIYFFIILTGVLVLSLFSSVLAEEPEVYTVQPGDTLSLIAQEKYGSVSKWIWIYKANKTIISDKDRIYPGQKFVIPKTEPGYIPREDQPVQIVTGNSYPPFTDQKLPEDGMLTEIVELAFKKMGEEYELEFWGWQAGLDATVEGQFAATFPYAPNEERCKQFMCSDSLYEKRVTWFVRKDFSRNYTKPEDLQGMVVCKAEGYLTHDIQEHVEKGILTMKTPRPRDIEDCFKMLSQREVDAVPVNEFTGWSIVKKIDEPKEDFKTFDEPGIVSDLCLLFSRNYPGAKDLMEKFNQTLADLKQIGAYDIIKKRHLKYYWEKEEEGLPE